jgi:hypothetical protein
MVDVAVVFIVDVGLVLRSEERIRGYIEFTNLIPTLPPISRGALGTAADPSTDSRN